MTRNAARTSCLSLWAPFLILAVLTASGCGAKLTASHLTRAPWQDGGSQKIYAKFMHFDFETMPHDDKFEVKGTAWTVKENMPPWVDSVSGLTLYAYLCDEHGNVLNSVSKHYPSEKIPETGFPFDFMIKHGDRPSGGYYVTFGYSGMFTASRPPKTGGQGSGGIAGNYVFFANEQAALSK